MKITVRTADRIQQGQLDLDPGVEGTTTVADLLVVLRENFKLQPGSDYFVRSDTAGKQLDPSQTIGAAGIKDGDVLEVAPILQAGG